MGLSIDEMRKIVYAADRRNGIAKNRRRVRRDSVILKKHGYCGEPFNGGTCVCTLRKDHFEGMCFQGAWPKEIG